MENQEWTLNSLSIYKSYDGNKNTYSGNISFSNGQQIKTEFRLDNEDCRQFVALVSDKIKSSANMFAESLIKSLPVSLPEKAQENNELL